MFDLALTSAGARVVLSTSSDEKHPPEHMIDGDQDSFWVTTGMFPQEFVISFTAPVNIKSIQIHSYNVKKIVLERSTQSEPRDFEVLLEKELRDTDSQMQREEFSIGNTSAEHLRVVIESGYDHFVSIHKLSVDGTASR